VIPTAVAVVRKRGRKKKLQKALIENSVEWKLCKMFTSQWR
jgi:hypothetical protein